MEHTDVLISLESSLNQEISSYVYQGSYRKKGNIHCITYTDSQEDTVTKVRIDAGPKSMVLVRAGSIRTRMQYDPSAETSVTYDFGGFQTAFILHTDRYELKVLENSIEVHLDYSLREKDGTAVTKASQHLTVRF